MDVSRLRRFGRKGSCYGFVRADSFHLQLHVLTTIFSVIMGANIAGIYGAQIFRSDDKPRYRRGFSINIAILTIGVTFAFGRYLDDLRRRRKIAQQIRDDYSDETLEGGSVAVVVDDLKAVAPRTIG